MNKERYINKLNKIKESGNYRVLRDVQHNGFLIHYNEREMLNLSSNDYLGLASNPVLYEDFRKETDVKLLSYSAVSSRLLSGNHEYYGLLENDLSDLYGKEAALVLNSGYHANIGILPALAGKRDLIVADKLVHASIIDGLRLSEAEMLRYRHLDYEHLREILFNHREEYENVFIVTESIFSMDGDRADLQALAGLKRRYDNVLLYVDEAHAFGVRGKRGLGCAEESGCIRDIDFLVGTFGKAAASVGAYIVCRKTVREYLVNRMRTLIFTTGLPPVNIAWTLFVVRRLADMQERREHLAHIGRTLREALQARGYTCPGASHIVPMIVGQSADTVLQAEALQRHGFYALPVRPPTVPEGTSRIRFSLTAEIRSEEIEELTNYLTVHTQT